MLGQMSFPEGASAIPFIKSLKMIDSVSLAARPERMDHDCFHCYDRSQSSNQHSHEAELLVS